MDLAAPHRFNPRALLGFEGGRPLRREADRSKGGRLLRIPPFEESG